MRRISSPKAGVIPFTCIFLGLLLFFNISTNDVAGKISDKHTENNKNPVVIYDDALASGWELALNDSRTNLNLSHMGIVQSGSNSIKLEVTEDWGTFNLRPTNGAIQFSEYTTLRFWIYSDSRIQLKLKDGSGEYTALAVTEFRDDVPLPVNEWTLIEADLSQYWEVGTQFTEMRWMGAGDRQPTFYLDQIELVKADSVAVDFPSSDHQWIYYDLLSTDWELATVDNRTNRSWAESNTVHSGNRSIKIEVDEDWGGFALKPKSGAIQLGEYKTLRFWIYTTNRIQLKLKDGEGPYTTHEVTDFRNNVPLPPNEWTLIEADLSQYASDVSQFTELLWMGFGDRQPTFYLDQIELVKHDEQEQATAETIYLIPRTNLWIDNVFRWHHDIHSFDPVTKKWSSYVDASDIGLNTIDAFQVINDGTIYLSINGTVDLTSEGLGEITDHDILKFIPTSLGRETAGTLELYFDGSDVGLTDGAEVIESFAILKNGDLVIGGNHQLNVGMPINSGSLARFSPTSLGENTSGTWSIFLDGRDIIDNSTLFEGITGIYISESDENPTDVYLTYANDVTMQGTTYPKGSVIRCKAISLGSTSSCESSLFWQASDAGIIDESLNGLSLKFIDDVGGTPNTPTPTPTPIVSTTPTPTLTPETTPVGNNEYTISINDGKIFTRRSEVTLHFTAPASTTHVKISNDGGFSGSEWEPYAETVTWEIDSFLNFLLPRVVYARFRDANGSTTSVYSDDIILDVLAPWGRGNAYKVNNNNFRLSLNVDDDVSGLDKFRLSNEETFLNSEWLPFEEDINIALSDSQGELFLQLSDKAGNVSDPIEVQFFEDSIYLPVIRRDAGRK